jgi:hypothetical protein
MFTLPSIQGITTSMFRSTFIDIENLLRVSV